MRTERMDEMLLVKYLLGNLSEEEQVQVEDRAFVDADYLSALEGVEADLIDSYVRGELAPGECEAFEGRFLASPQRRNKVEFARALAAVAAETSIAAPILAGRQSTWQLLVNLVRGWNPAMQLAGAMAALVCIAGVSWLVAENAGMRSRVTALEAQRRTLEQREQVLQHQIAEEQGRAGSLAARTEKSPAKATPALIASLVLLPGLSRADTRVQQLALIPGAQLAHIEIQLEPRDDFAHFRAELHTRSGDEVLVRGNLVRRRTGSTYAVSFDVPASALSPGDYELALKGNSGDQPPQDIGYYYFNVRN